MSVARHGSRLAELGHPVFELANDSKIPPKGSRWANGGATVNPVDAFSLLMGAGHNLGVRCDRLVVVDVDPRNGGNETFATIEGEGLPATYKVRTAGGGFHLYYRAPEGAKLSGSTGKLGKGVDVKAGPGAYVVGAGSMVADRAYTLEADLPIADCPAWLVERLAGGREKAPNAGQVIGELDTPAAVESARGWLLSSSAPIAVEGDAGDPTTYQVACAVMDRGVSPEKCFDLMWEHWNPRCAPPWEPHDLEAKVDNAAQYRQEPIGRDNPAAGFEPVKLPAPAASDVLEYASDVSVKEIIDLESNAIVKGILRPGESGMIYGASTTGKTFAAMDFGWCVALGSDWHGHKVKRRRPILYVALEGVGGFRKRMLAAAARHGDPGKYFARLKLPVSLVRAEAGAKGVKTIVDAYRMLLAETGEDRGVIVIDTLARAMAGDDENSTADMTHFVENRQGAIGQATGAAVVVIHHTNKQGSIRGNTSNFGAQDLVIRIERDGDDRQAIAEKVKDGREGPMFDFELEEVQLGVDNDGVPITSCVLKASEPKSKPARATAAQKAFIKAFDAACSEITWGETGEVLPAATLEDVRAAMARFNNPSTARSYWSRLETADGFPTGFERRTLSENEWFVDLRPFWFAT